MLRFTLILQCCLFFSLLSAQDTIKPLIVPAQILNGDTLPLIDVSPSVIFPPASYTSSRNVIRYDRLVHNVKKVYPYAKLAGIKLREFEQILDTIRSDKERRNFTKKAQKQLEAEFGDDIRDLTYSQGKILIKLIYRETGSSSFELIKDLRGGFTAFIWQSLAGLFGYDLKTKYLPEGDDQVIERIVLMIEAGTI